MPKLSDFNNELPAKLAQPAQRALSRAGIKDLEQLSEWTVEQLASLHGIGKNAVSILTEAMLANRLEFKKESNVDRSQKGKGSK